MSQDIGKKLAGTPLNEILQDLEEKDDLPKWIEELKRYFQLKGRNKSPKST